MNNPDIFTTSKCRATYRPLNLNLKAKTKALTKDQQEIVRLKASIDRFAKALGQADDEIYAMAKTQREIVGLAISGNYFGGRTKALTTIANILSN